ncbi:5' nucleotidase, NT5C type [Paenibacillus alkalitolerans]|uniref:5' nucleotidase, NT5C type n=1 Tax=Paenibacillus alkalitolerans TaxID=2799335 RepID=UPI0018F5794D|nr:hypothetical protein [Paenibacillus alkalitolerans]
MHIGIDLDNTVLDATTAYLHYYNKASGLSMTHDDVNEFHLYRLYGWDEEQHRDVYNRYGHDIHWNSEPYPMAVDVIRQLFQQHQISIITARPVMFRDVSIEWLKRHDVPYHNIVLTENKLEECIRSKADVLIDDGPHYAKQFAEQRKPIILIGQPYNTDVNNEYVFRVTDWVQVAKHIDLMTFNKTL